jgi:hypothetical protein
MERRKDNRQFSTVVSGQTVEPLGADYPAPERRFDDTSEARIQQHLRGSDSLDLSEVSLTPEKAETHNCCWGILVYAVLLVAVMYFKATEEIFGVWIS